MALAAATLLVGAVGPADEALAARTGGMAGGRAFRSAPRAAPRGGSARMGGMRGGGMYGGGGAMYAPPLMGGYGFSPFGFGFSPFFFPGGGFLFNIMFLLFAAGLSSPPCVYGWSVR